MKNIEIPMFDEKELQDRFYRWLDNRKTKYDKPKAIKSETIKVYPTDEQDAFWIGCSYVALANRLYDGPLTTTLSG